MAGAAAASIDSYCNRVSLTTSSNGGFVTPPRWATRCRRSASSSAWPAPMPIEQGDSLAGTVQGFSMAEMEEQCEAFAPRMTGYQSRLASQAPEEVRAALQEFVVSTGAPPAQMSGNARICLGLGYRSDNAEVALAAALVLVGLGEDAYGELLGHHLVNGFATPQRPDRGVEWLGDAARRSRPAPARWWPARGHAALLSRRSPTLSGGGARADAAGGGGAPGEPGLRAADGAGRASN